MNRINWTQVAVFGLIVVLVFGCGLIALITAFGGGWGMGPGMMGSTGGGWCPWCSGTGRLFGGGLFSGLAGLLFMGLMMLVPVALLVLLILGVVWLVRSTGRTTPPSAPAKSCPNCGQPVEPHWKNCPHCGQELK